MGGYHIPRVPDREPAPLPEETPLKTRIASAYRKRTWPINLAGGTVIAVAAILLVRVLSPQAPTLSVAEVDSAVERILEEQLEPIPYTVAGYRRVLPSVVLIQTFVNHEGEEVQAGLGTGVVIEDTGLILTNLHVVVGGERISVTFANGHESIGTVAGTDVDRDLAVIQAQVLPDDLIPATLAGSRGLQVGDEVFVVGNPFGITYSLSAGVISGLRRTYEDQDSNRTLEDLIQFDAAVNPGNSGGPLVNRDGEVVGIVTALVHPDDGNHFVGIGFAVPMETAAGAAGPPQY